MLTAFREVSGHNVESFADIIASKSWCVADGATGTNLFKCGLETGYPPELWSVERLDQILWLHKSFLDAGSASILTNSFGGISFRLKFHHAQHLASKLNITAARRPFDATAMTTVLGEAWVGLNISGAAAGDKSPRGGQSVRRG